MSFKWISRCSDIIFDSFLLAFHSASRGPGNHELLDEEKQDERRKHGQRRRSHQAAPIRSILLHEGLNAYRYRHPILVPEKDARDKKLVV